MGLRQRPWRADAVRGAVHPNTVTESIQIRHFEYIASRSVARTSHGGCIVSALTRRAAIAAFGALALLPTVVGQRVLAQPDLTFRDIRVDVAPLRENAGDPTAAWVQRELPVQLAQALAGRMSRNGATLIVRIDTLALGPNGGDNIHSDSSWDNISGVAIVDGAQFPVRATASYRSSPIDQTMIEQSNHRRVSQLVQALAYWIGR